MSNQDPDGRTVVVRSGGSPAQELGIVIGIEISPFRQLGSRALYMRDVSVKKGAFVLLGGLMRMHMGGWRLQESKRQDRVQQERDEELHRRLYVTAAFAEFRLAC